MKDFIEHDSVADPGDALQEKRITNYIDVTYITNGMMPESWTCPHCHNRMKSGSYSNEILLKFGKVVEQCRMCGYLHIFILILTDDFKKKVIDFIKKYQ